MRQIGKRALTVAFQATVARELREPVLPEFNSFPGLIDRNAVSVGTSGAIDWGELQGAGLMMWEWGWTPETARRMLEIKNRLGVAALMFVGPLDRFWRELAIGDVDLQFEAARASEAVGAMLEDTVGFYQQLIPSAHVFHLPVPVDASAFRAGRPTQRDRNLILLTAPTRFTGTASQLPITTFVAFRELLRFKPALRGLCFVYDDDERTGTERALRALGLADRVEVQGYLRPIQRYLMTAGRCYAGLSLPHGMLQGRNAMTCACLEIPLVVSEEVETHRRLYPATAVRWYDTAAAVERMLRILDDGPFRASVVEHASRAVEFYSVEHCRTRLRDGVDAAAARRGALSRV